MYQATSGAEVRVATEKIMSKETGERIVYIKGTQAQREKALELIRSNPKVGVCTRLGKQRNTKGRAGELLGTCPVWWSS